MGLTPELTCLLHGGDQQLTQRSGTLGEDSMPEGAAGPGWGSRWVPAEVDLTTTVRHLTQRVHTGSETRREGSQAADTWIRWGLLLLAAGALSYLLLAAWRERLGSLGEFEHLRRRIASDLHDEIGSGLSQIVILSEVAQRVGQGQPSGGALPRIAETSRELLDSTSDMVWAINPRRDRLDDLIQRMRRFAEEVLSGAGIEVDFQAPEMTDGRRLGLESRREIYLIFRESIRNVMRHARASHVTVRVSSRSGWFQLEVQDDGKGFDVASAAPGNGLRSMQERARAMGGRIGWSCGPGTRVTLSVPLPN